MITVPGLTFRHAKYGALPVRILTGQLPGVGKMYVQNNTLAKTLRGYGVETSPWRTFAHMASSQFSSKRSFFLGFSGYTDPRFSYELELRTIRAIYQHLLSKGRLPTSVSDGGGKDGVLGANARAARQFNVKSIAFTPLQGLETLSSRDHIVVWGDTFHQREVLVGLLPDMLLVVGGQKSAINVCVQAADFDTPVVIIEAKKYKDPQGITNTWRQVPKLVKAHTKKRLFVCRPDDDIPSALDRALLLVDKNRADEAIRTNRLRALYTLMGLQT